MPSISAATANKISSLDDCLRRVIIVIDVAFPKNYPAMIARNKNITSGRVTLPLVRYQVAGGTI
jgi:hypothetical protein